MDPEFLNRVTGSMFAFLCSPLYRLFNLTHLNRSPDSRAFRPLCHFPSRRSRFSPVNLSTKSHTIQMAQMTNTPEKEIILQAEDGSDFVAYITVPATVNDGSSTPTMVLMTDILGCQNDETRGVARRLASEGFPTSTLSSSTSMSTFNRSMCEL